MFVLCSRCGVELPVFLILLAVVIIFCGPAWAASIGRAILAVIRSQRRSNPAAERTAAGEEQHT